MNAGPFSPDKVATTIAELPEQGSPQIRILRERALAHDYKDQNRDE